MSITYQPKKEKDKKLMVFKRANSKSGRKIIKQRRKRTEKF